MLLKELKDCGNNILRYCGMREMTEQMLTALDADLDVDYYQDTQAGGGDCVSTNRAEYEKYSQIRASLTTESVFGELYQKSNANDHELLDALLNACEKNVDPWLWGDHEREQCDVAHKMCEFLRLVGDLNFAEKTFTMEDVQLITDAGKYFSELAKNSYDYENDEIHFHLDETEIIKFLQNKELIPNLNSSSLNNPANREDNMKLKDLRKFGNALNCYVSELSELKEELAGEFMSKETRESMLKKDTERAYNMYLAKYYQTTDTDTRHLLDSLLEDFSKWYFPHSLYPETNRTRLTARFMDTIGGMEFAEKTFTAEDVELIKVAGDYFSKLASFARRDAENHDYTFALGETEVNDFLQKYDLISNLNCLWGRREEMDFGGLEMRGDEVFSLRQESSNVLCADNILEFTENTKPFLKPLFKDVDALDDMQVQLSITADRTSEEINLLIHLSKNDNKVSIPLDLSRNERWQLKDIIEAQIGEKLKVSEKDVQRNSFLDKKPKEKRNSFSLLGKKTKESHEKKADKPDR